MRFGMGMKAAAIGVAAGVGTFVASPASAQAWIGLMVGDMISRQQAAIQEHNCMTGTPMPEKEIAEARDPALALMPRYWASAKASKPADVSGFFHLDKKTQWTGGGATLAMAGVTAVSDPFAMPGSALDETPLGLVRSGDAQSAAGQWAVRDASGRRTGTYKAYFTRKAGEWRLSTLELVAGTVYVDPLAQYCHKPDDVLPYRISNSEWSKAYTAKRALKAEAKASAASDEAAAAQAAADKAEGSGKAAKQAKAQLAAEKAQRANETAALRKSEAEKAAGTAAAAQADLKALEAQRAAGRAAIVSGQPVPAGS